MPTPLRTYNSLNESTPTFFKAILAIPTASDSTEAQASNNSSDTLSKPSHSLQVPRFPQANQLIDSCQPSYKLLGEAQDRTVGMSRQEQGPVAGGILADQRGLGKTVVALVHIYREVPHVSDSI